MKHSKKSMTAILFALLMVFPSYVVGQTGIFDGRPIFAEGAELGYYVWRDGETWHVRWTTMGRMRFFSGSVEATGGELKSFKRVDVETERKVLYPGRAPAVRVGPRGRVHSRGGRAPVVVERKQDKIEKDGDRRIVFSARTNNDIDGFQFKLDKDVVAVRFVLEIDGRRMPQHVEIGRNNVKAPRIPLEVSVP